MTAPADPLPMTILVVDAESFSQLRNPQQLAARDLIYAVLADSFDAVGVPWARCRQEDRGDGVLVLVGAEIPKPAVLRVLAELSARLARPIPPGLRLRAALHAGDVHTDPHGVAGADVNLAFRLADCQPLRQALRESRGHLAVIVSDALYHGIVRHDYAGIHADSFCPVTVRAKETEATGWLTVPGDDACARRIAGHAAGAPLASQPSAHDGVRFQSGASVEVSQSVLAGRDARQSTSAGRPTRAGWRARRRGDPGQ
jgi:hypothetical protein